MFCRKCGYQISEKDQFCKRCGTKTLKNEVAKPQPAAPEKPVNPAPASPKPAASEKPKTPAPVSPQPAAQTKPIAPPPVAPPPVAPPPVAPPPVAPPPVAPPPVAPPPVAPPPFATQNPVFQNSFEAGVNNGSNAPSKKSGKGAVIVLVIIILALVGALIYVILTMGKKSGDEPDKESERSESSVDEHGKKDDEDKGGDEEDDTESADLEVEYYTFGSYEQDGDTSNGPEPIEWVVLDENENGTLLVSRYVLDCVVFSDDISDMTWENSILRSWLNKTFYKTAFNDEEKARICLTHVVNNDNKYWGTSAGPDTYDNVFVLSVDEVMKYYDFNWSDDVKQLYASEDLIIDATPYAQSKDLEYENMYIDEDLYHEFKAEFGYSDDCLGRYGSWWWLRTPGEENETVCDVAGYGIIGYSADSMWDSGDSPDFANGVRPAIYIYK